jgi:flavin reductase (DIM6/NTAB) family NADH-FMN oxidoreductase RutF
MKHVAQPLEAKAVVAPDTFRESLRLLSGGVSVITTGRGADISGMTVTSVSPLSLDPPTLTVFVNRQASSWPILLREKSFGVNFLSADQQRIAEDFSGKGGRKGAERFANAPWQTLETGAPILKGTLASIDCDVEEILERHSHGIVIGRVRAVTTQAQPGALVYWQGRYLPVSATAITAQILPFTG